MGNVHEHCFVETMKPLIFLSVVSHIVLCIIGLPEDSMKFELVSANTVPGD